MLRTRINICQWGQKYNSLNSVNISDTISRFFLNIKSPNIDKLFRKQDIILMSFCILSKCMMILNIKIIIWENKSNYLNSDKNKNKYLPNR